MHATNQVGIPESPILTHDEQQVVITTFSRPRRPSRIHIAPIRSLTVRDVAHHPSRRTLRLSEGDGHADVDADERHKPPDEPHNITRAIGQLESLVQQITELAEQPSHPTNATPKERRPSEDIAAKGHAYLANANASPENGGSSRGQQSRLTFSAPQRQPAQAATEEPEVQANGNHGVQACGPAHGESIGTKAAAAAANPQIVVTAAIDRTIKPSGEAEKELRRQQEQQNRKVAPPQHPAPPIPLQKRRKSAIDPRVNEPGQHRLGLPLGLKPDRRDVSPFEDEEEQSPWTLQVPRPGHERHFTQMFGIRHNSSVFRYERSQTSASHMVDLKRVNHVDLLNKPEAFDVHTSCDHAPIARNWPDSRKRFAATVTCINASCLGLLIGIYSGEVPAIQYKIADFHHFVILGNVFLYCGLAVSTFLFWPLPLLHGRKVYTVAGLATALGLQIPQGIVVIQSRMPDDVTWRTLLLLSRALSGLALGLVNLNLLPTLHDLYGASLQSSHPHGEFVDPFDVRRHGGGMGLWLAAWSWCTIGPIGLGFGIGAFIVDKSSVDWGFWISMMVLMFTLLLNLVAPETRRAAFRRTMAEFLGDRGPFSRVTRGEIKMHIDETGPYWWAEELEAGFRLCWRMVKQPGFLALAVYTAWVDAQFTLILMLLGALCSRYYHYKPVWVGLCALSLGAGALLAVPFQKASLFSRARRRRPRSDSETLRRSEFWTSHLVRRTLFTVLLPLGGIGYALTARGPPFPAAIPCVMAAIVGYFSNLATAECMGLVMETFDTSDLQPGMTGRPLRGSAVERIGSLRTNFTCYPRVTAGIMITHGLQFTLAAAATGLGGRMERSIGAMQASGVTAGILLALTILLTMVLWRWKTVQMIPSQRVRQNRAGSSWEPVVLGEPSGWSRKISVLEAGRQTRWSEIRRRNRLEASLTSG